jgi:hypothetical protein
MKILDMDLSVCWKPGVGRAVDDAEGTSFNSACKLEHSLLRLWFRLSLASTDVARTCLAYTHITFTRSHTHRTNTRIQSVIVCHVRARAHAKTHTHTHSVYRSHVTHTCAHANTDNISGERGREIARTHTTQESEIEPQERESIWYRGKERERERTRERERDV